MKKLQTKSTLTLDSLKEVLTKKFPEYRVRITGVGPGRRVIVSRSMFCGVDASIKEDNQLIVNGSLMPSTTAVVLFGIGCAAGLIGGFILGVVIGSNGKRMESEVADALAV